MEELELASDETDYSNFEDESFWKEDVAAVVTSSTENVAIDFATGGCNLFEKCRLRTKSFDLKTELLKDIDEVFPFVIQGVFIAILIGMACWIGSYAICRIILAVEKIIKKITYASFESKVEKFVWKARSFCKDLFSKICENQVDVKKHFSISTMFDVTAFYTLKELNESSLIELSFEYLKKQIRRVNQNKLTRQIGQFKLLSKFKQGSQLNLIKLIKKIKKLIFGKKSEILCKV